MPEVLRDGKRKKIGKVDFLLAQVEGGKAIDFAALEVQAVYISGKTIRPAFDQYLRTGVLTDSAPHLGQFTFTNSGTFASGEPPCCVISIFSGKITATARQAQAQCRHFSQWIMGMGVPE